MNDLPFSCKQIFDYVLLISHLPAINVPAKIRCNVHQSLQWLSKTILVCTWILWNKYAQFIHIMWNRLQHTFRCTKQKPLLYLYLWTHSAEKEKNQTFKNRAVDDYSFLTPSVFLTTQVKALSQFQTIIQRSSSSVHTCVKLIITDNYNLSFSHANHDQQAGKKSFKIPAALP